MIFSGKQLAKKKLSRLSKKIRNLNLPLRLDIIYIGKDESSEIFINHKLQTAKKLGVKTKVHKFEKKVKFDEIKTLCHKLNKDRNCTGYFFQLPIPSKLDEQQVLELIDPSKDVDCLTSTKLGKIMKGLDTFAPATVEAIMSIFTDENVKLQSKNIVIINDSNLIGKPLSMKLLNQKATVTICNKFTKNLKSVTGKADILISATGMPNLITQDMVKKNTILIDVGFSHKNGQIKGDMDFERLQNKTQLITPVPGGVGPLTVIYLFKNLLKLHETKNN